MVVAKNLFLFFDFKKFVVKITKYFRPRVPKHNMYLNLKFSILQNSEIFVQIFQLEKDPHPCFYAPFYHFRSADRPQVFQ